MFRIYPLLIFCIAIDLILSRLPWTTGIGYLTLSEPCCAYIYWSIPPEFQFYFMIPLLGVAARAFPRSTLVGLMTTALISIVFARGYDFFGFVSTFFFGSVAALLLIRWPEIAKAVASAWPAAPLVALLCSIPIIQAIGLNIIPWDWNGMHGALWGVAVLAVALRVPTLKWLAMRPLRYLGAISFSVYLTHPWVVAMARHFELIGTAAGPIIFVFVILFATLAFRAVEAPGIALGRLIEKRLDVKKRQTEMLTP
ncbi:hypothetical protein J4G48_0020260 [Bradyrhizobium barranii subsp. apii]|uniref:acyltransferase family protein n=1 Tax=Bradyrhizobium barranii TaxID=2992140 RepID=UPI002070C163|nr:acyltransferase family protein [Bradyrhizobium barranii]UPU00218.1 hypothetical protein J4G48_0020260 [Bradyrhizobium barranii subsp. apii]